MTKNHWLIVLVLLIAIAGKAQNDTVVFSARGGFYEASFALHLYNYNISAKNHIRYTTNGSRPDAQSPIYCDSLFLDEHLFSKSNIYTIVNCPETEFYLPDSVQHCIVIRAAVFDGNDSCISQVMTNSYFIRDLGCNTHGLPVVSLCADSLDLFDYYNGIFVPGVWWSPSLPTWTGNYFHKGRAWERQCHVEFYEQDNQGINQEAGLRTHGGASRRFQQKGMKVYARKEYGKKRFKHAFFDDVSINNIKHFTLKPFRSSSWLHTGLNDALCHRVARQLDIEVLGTRAAVVFLNGEYWGIYYLEEATDEHYLEDHFDIDPDDCNIIKNWNTLEAGDDTQWQELYTWTENVDLSDSSNYEYICSKIDMCNFIDYLIFELYSANVDWPANNVRCWQSGDRKWRWMFYDGDGCFFSDWDVFANIIDTSNNLGPSNATSTLFYRKLLENRIFHEQFLSHFEELMMDKLNYSHTSPILATLREQIQNEVPCQSFRFNFPACDSVWSSHVDMMDTYLQNRNQSLEALIFTYLSVSDNPVSFTCYPNPCSDLLHIKIFSVEQKNEEMKIFDTLGRCICQEKVQLHSGMNSISTQFDLTPGVYLLQIGGHVQRIVRF
jgi:hypothetical protein